MSVLGRLVSDSEVLRSAWELQPVHSKDLGAFDDVFQASDADDLVATRGLRLPDFRLVQDGATIATSVYTRTGGTGRNSFTGQLDPESVYDLVGQGATLVLQGLRRYLPSVNDFCNELGEELSHRFHANAYLTPPGACGAGPHYDMHSVFIRQISGSKRWRVQQPVETWPRRRYVPGQRLGTPVVGEWTLFPGDCLYIPRGYVHEGWTLEDAGSVHVTFGTSDPLTWAGILAQFVARMNEDEAARSTLPMGFATQPELVEQDMRTQVASLIERLGRLDFGDESRRLCEQQMSKREADGRGVLLSLMGKRPTHGSRAQARAGINLRLDYEESRFIVESELKRIEFPQEVGPVVQRLLDGREHEIASLTELEPASAILLVHRLQLEGFVIVD